MTVSKPDGIKTSLSILQAFCGQLQAEAETVIPVQNGSPHQDQKPVYGPVHRNVEQGPVVPQLYQGRQISTLKAQFMTPQGNPKVPVGKSSITVRID